MQRRKVMIGGGLALAAGVAGLTVWKRNVGSMTAYEDYQRRLRSVPGQSPELGELVRYATLAASGHNTQPWRFSIADNAIDILPDHSRATPVVDPDDHHLFVSLGCAIENLVIAGAATGRPGKLEIGPFDGGVARFPFSSGTATPDALFDAIPLRQATRADYDGRTVSAADLMVLEHMAAEPGTRTILITDGPRKTRIRDLVVAGNDRQMTDPAFLAELKQWIRFNPASAASAGDGLFSAASGSPAVPSFLGPAVFDLFVTASFENKKYARQIDSSAGLAVFLADRADEAHWIRVGRACQRFALAATNLGLKHAFVNQPVEVADLRPELAAIVGEPNLRPDLIVRFGYGPQMPFSPRRPVAEVLA